jgi:hypothetical protein
VCIALLASACASVRWSLQKSLRREGTEIEAFPEAVWEEYDCDHQQRPFFIIERNELVPPKVGPGGEFNHRLVYAMCPPEPTEVVQGRLETRIRFKGEPYRLGHEERYEIQPGRWVVDRFVEIPEHADPGVYAYEVEFESPNLQFEKSLTFIVRKP